MPKQYQKYIKNQVCGIHGCHKPAILAVTFQLGFSARFCTLCANDLINQGLAIKLDDNPK